MGEDLVSSYACILSANRLVVVNEVKGYFYRYNAQAMTKKYNSDFTQTLRILFKEVDRVFLSEPELSTQFYKQVLNFKVMKLVMDGMANEACGNKFTYGVRLFKYFQEIISDRCFYDILCNKDSASITLPKKKKIWDCLKKRKIKQAVFLSFIPKCFWGFRLGSRENKE